MRVIGCGQLGRIHTEALLEIGRMKMTAFCDVVQEKAESYAAKYGGDYAVNDPGRIFADDRIDAVYICTQHDSHAQFCIQALDAGKHVMVEKPLALTVAECLAINAAVNRSKAKLMTAFKMRYFELIAKAKALIPHPLLVTMQMMDNRWPTGSWVNDPIKGGGNVLSQGCHSCDILRFVAGSDPVEVYAAGGNYYQESGVVDNLAATFRMENGTACSWVQGDCNCPSRLVSLSCNSSRMEIRTKSIAYQLTMNNRQSAASLLRYGKRLPGGKNRA